MTSSVHLNTAAGFLRIGEAMDAWNELECIKPLNRAKTEVLTVRMAVCRALKKWELAEEVARTLVKREPHNEEQKIARKLFGPQIKITKDGQLELVDLPAFLKKQIAHTLAEKRVETPNNKTLALP